MATAKQKFMGKKVTYIIDLLVNKIYPYCAAELVGSL